MSSSSLPVTDQAKTSLFPRFPVLKFYRGSTVTTVGMIPYVGTYILFWGFLRAHFFPHRKGGSKTGAGPHADLSIGAVSGALAQTVSYPFEVIRRRMQVRFDVARYIDGCGGVRRFRIFGRRAAGESSMLGWPLDIRRSYR